MNSSADDYIDLLNKWFTPLDHTTTLIHFIDGSSQLGTSCYSNFIIEKVFGPIFTKIILMNMDLVRPCKVATYYFIKWQITIISLKEFYFICKSDFLNKSRPHQFLE